LSDLSVSSDLYHCEKCLGENPQNAVVAAKWLGIPTGVICVAQPDDQAKESHGQLEEEESGVMYRGRAAKNLLRARPAIPGKDSIPVRMKTSSSRGASISIRLATSTSVRGSSSAVCSRNR
jgi:hypothetical protein